MGQKIHPRLLRLGTSTTWRARWFDTKNYAVYLLEDVNIRRVTNEKFKKAISDIEIERTGTELTINLYTSKPGVIIGRGGAGIEDLKKILKPVISSVKLNVNIHEIKRPDTNAAVIANSIAEQIERRIPFRRAMKQAMEAAKQARVQGIKIVVAGRLNGAEIARTESLSYGKVPLHTIKYPIDYAARTAMTTYGTIGIKVWTLDEVQPNDEKAGI